MAAYQKLVCASILLALLVAASVDAQSLKVGFYKKTCPKAEAIVRKTAASYIARARTLAAPTLRMFFHDCFIRGCDGSILLNTTNPNNPTEKSAPPNAFLRGFQIIDEAKARLEKACPGVVSCTDILALVTRDVVNLVNGPHWDVETGRRDGKVSVGSDTATLPAFTNNITTLKASFAGLGLSAKDLVVLSGAHTIGTGHCFAFTNRLYNFTGKGDTDPSMDPNYIARLKTKCANVPNDLTTFVEMDPGSFKTFDSSSYYTLVLKRRGLFQSDAALLDDPETKAYVKKQATTHGSTFYKDFGRSMVKLGRVGVLTGKAGEIRKKCGFVN